MADLAATPADRAQAARAFLALRPEREQHPSGGDSAPWERHDAAERLATATPGGTAWAEGETLAARVRERRDAWRRLIGRPRA